MGMEIVREIKEVSRYRTWFEPRHPDIQASIISPSTVWSPLNSLFLTFMDSGSWWWTGRPGVLRFMGSQGIRHDWATELNCTDIYANSQVECRSLVFTPNVLVFDGSFHPCFTISQQNSTWATVWFMSSSFLLSPWFTWAYGFRIT